MIHGIYVLAIGRDRSGGGGGQLHGRTGLSNDPGVPSSGRSGNETQV